MNAARARRGAWIALAVCAFAGVSWVIFRSYLTPDMMMYFLTFRWCL
ncbi:MAG TPA: hypothetical protein VLJ84_00785 [Usitatibacter sp.]|jgi:hypothetical protein|nr:hypothetical protein [Usitatibacter sp.]